MPLHEARDIEGVRAISLPFSPTTCDQMAVFRGALEIFEDKNNSPGGYEDLWKKSGWGEQLLHMRSKLNRIERRFRDQGAAHQDLDDAYDLLNYVAFFIRNVLDGNPGE